LGTALPLNPLPDFSFEPVDGELRFVEFPMFEIVKKLDIL